MPMPGPQLIREDDNTAIVAVVWALAKWLPGPVARSVLQY